MLQCYYRQILGMVQYCCARLIMLLPYLLVQNLEMTGAQNGGITQSAILTKDSNPPFQIYHYILKYKIFKLIII